MINIFQTPKRIVLLEDQNKFLSIRIDWKDHRHWKFEGEKGTKKMKKSINKDAKQNQSILKNK